MNITIMPSSKKNRKLDQQTQDQIRKEVLASESTKNFADPTYDVTFKMLCANKDFLKYLINIFLDFKEDKVIDDVEFLPQELVANHSMEQKVIFDLRCQTNHDEEVIVEMQRQYKKYFICRMQYYMARLVVNEIFAGDSENIHEKLKKTHILVISKDNLIKGKEYVDDDKYEQTVMPTIAERGHMEMFQNVMHWKFAEVRKFVKALEKGKVNLRTDKKAQLLYFFDNCAKINSMDEVQDYFDPDIKKGYEIMMKTNLEKEGKMTEYLQETIEEMFDRKEREEIEAAFEEACKKAKIEGEAIGEAKGETKGKLEGKLEGKLDMLQKLIVKSISHATLVDVCDDLTEQQITVVEAYVHENGLVPVEKLMGLVAEPSSEYAT
ncbi:hypothetical protein phytr_6780 [Candidatus Phycorickettsia trachydisci]|uniref:Uncharacterized protein n=1 Tax=Candidatus Phycorickettsia trachydisci TaxID=2115978 RepID=A0A2P1P8M1_9RICK|nr:PD-(D/E)XK nuclease family transposase [Candidatus Phycorickettsia trachydisci]AVP87619.1 hypothetical protein phytr_6780 [Candidatus Phycorickettsia trachydisci]